MQAFFFKEDEHNCKHTFSVIESFKKDATLMDMYLFANLLWTCFKGDYHSIIKLISKIGLSVFKIYPLLTTGHSLLRFISSLLNNSYFVLL